MKIAQVSPLFESVPPKFYGGTERVVSYLTEGLVRLGHEVTLFASGDSVTSARLVPIGIESLRLSRKGQDPLARHLAMFEEVLEGGDQFDIVHFHTDYLHLPSIRGKDMRHLTTLHGRLDLPELVSLYQRYAEIPVISISDAQRSPLPLLNWQKTIYHGLPLERLAFQAKPGKYLAFLGRFAPEKRPDRAIAIAKAFGMPIKMAAKVDKADEEYYLKMIRPQLAHPSIEFVGEINEAGKSDFLGNAYALLFPIDWPEPFGLVIIEAMACGTPVIAYPHGSVIELIEDQATGFVVNSIAGAVRALKQVPSLSRKRIRDCFVQRFSVQRMVQDYVSVYEALQKKEVEFKKSAA